MTIAYKRWKIKDSNTKQAIQLAEQMGISHILASLLVNRGIDTPQKCEEFLGCDNKSFQSPLLLKDMDRAISRINYAIKKGQSIWVYGDYDVDGVTSTSLMVSALRLLGADVDYYIPSRFEEGYGINIDAIDFIKQSGGSLIITVDCGITAIREVEYANSCGVDIIITDHHQCQETMPEAYAVINPKRPDDNYPYKELAGVGVSFKLIQGLLEKEDYMQFLDLVTIGTIADVVSLTGENRAIVKQGLKHLSKTTNLGIKALMEVSGLGQRPIDTGSIGFGLAPRINASGRLGDAKKSVDLFLTHNWEQAKEIAEFLDRENRNRQEIEAEIYSEVVEKIQSQYNTEDKALVVYGEGWHHGVIGIVASKIVERYYRPCVLLTKEGDEVKGSARSISSFNIFEALSICKPLFNKFGGHHMAAGLSLDVDKFKDFESKFKDIAKDMIQDTDLIPNINVDSLLDFDFLTLQLAREVADMEPFGVGNPQPVFASKKVMITDIRTIGNEGKHLKLRLKSQGTVLDAIAFNQGQLQEKLAKDDYIDIAYCLEINRWMGQEKVQLNIKDIKKTKEIFLHAQNYSCYIAKSFDYTEQKQHTQALKDISIDSALYKITNYQNSAKNLIFCENSDHFDFISLLLNDTKELNADNICLLKNTETLYDNKAIVLVSPDYKGIINDLDLFDNIIVTGMFFNKQFYDIIKKQNQTIYDQYSKQLKVYIDNLLPQRDDFVCLYSYLKAKPSTKIMIDILSDTNYIFKMGIISLEKIKLMLRILEEADLIKYSLVRDNIYNIELETKRSSKADLQQTPSFKRLLEIKNMVYDNNV
jgi:single-stranded-DNA-specific exonuclease